MILTRMALALVMRAMGTLVSLLLAEPATWAVERIAEAADYVEGAR